MERYKQLLDAFVHESKDILGGELTGIYLHGSAAMGCFAPDKSDLDILIVVKGKLSDEVKKRYMEMVVRLNEKAPAKGIEMSIVTENVCRPFVYPTPFELHFSAAHLEWYRNAPDDYIRKMNGKDKDLAAHVTITKARGKTLFGKPIDEVFGEVGKGFYFDSIWCDVENAEDDILREPVYIILNLARVLAFAKDGLILSKSEGGCWGRKNLPDRFHVLLSDAMAEYESGKTSCYDRELSESYAGFMLDEIRKYKNV
ncbi:aminoglycoside adenylyltransferase domain-containing protein [Ruminococcus sp.]|uniref:aminoglycoside adenylyltransferase domain-containing protein n=1 Tax=Ruminococcus sp. TaxID=41978 RepID=UPI0025FF1095|nr:aminoglycoside adenylyltransferase domain-containing protein [Ruminococcus sp.]MBQ8965262.1 DUF4111 domain-containing protein [Ruminococcus sp.]